MLCLRFIQNGIDAVDRAGRHPYSGQLVQPPACGLCLKGSGDMRQQLLAIFYPGAVGCVGGVIGQPVTPGNGTKFPEL